MKKVNYNKKSKKNCLSKPYVLYKRETKKDLETVKKGFYCRE
jgi:hypothetical protein